MFTDVNADRPPAWRRRRRAVVIRIGAFSVAIDLRARDADLMEDISDLYAPYPRDSLDALPDLRLAVGAPNPWGTLFDRQIQILVDGRTPFQPMSRRLCVPLLESVINWFIGKYTTRFLLLHAGVVERDGRAILLPGGSGAGKSTLCAALIARGWRLLSDEFAMVRPSDGRMQPHPRPICLKNASIDVIVRELPNAHFSKRYEGTSETTDWLK